LLFANKIIEPQSLVHIANYYPRAIDSHAALGKTLQNISSKYNLKTFSLGDAGMAAYHSKLIALDNIGLGSSAVTHKGVTFELLDSYNPDITVFHARPEEGIRLKDYYQDIIYNWSLANGLKMVCDVYWQPDYTIRVFAKQPYPEIVELCKHSENANNHKDKAYFLKSVINPPWHYWKE